MAEETDTSRTTVRTYVPSYQKETWQAHADELGMSQSEFVRTMVQAGRKGFELDPAEGHPDTTNPRGETLKTRVLSTLETHEFLSWEELVDELSADLEDRLDDALGDLQGSNQIRYSGRHGGYVLVNDGN